MSDSNQMPPNRVESFDLIARDLQTLRANDGAPSYAEIVRRITDIRLSRGINAAAAIPARSTVYNAFQSGRTRLDTILLRDIVIALGADETQAIAWVQRCIDAQRKVESTTRLKRVESAAAHVRKPTWSSLGTTTSSPAWPAFIMLACVALNLIGLYTTHVFRLSVYLDMVGTAITSIALGPWHGVAVAVLSSNLGFLTGDPVTGFFTPVNVAGALLWGFGIRRFSMGLDLTRYVTLNLIVALGCSLVAAPLVVAVFSGHNGHASTQAVLSLESLGLPLMASVFSANIVTSIMDKLITGFIALSVFAVLHNKFGIPASHMPLIERLGSLRDTSARIGSRPGVRFVR